MARLSSLLIFLHVVNGLDNGLYRTPPMGWLSWSRFRCIVDCKTFPKDCISQELYLTIGKTMVADGWLDAGYEYVNIDDCWTEKSRDPDSYRLVADKNRFPDGIPRITSELHSIGLKVGIYSDVGPTTCAGYPGSLNHYELDAQTFADWDIDSLKFDGCNVQNVSEYHKLYPAMTTALNATGRPIAYVCSWPAYVVGHINTSSLGQYCNSWRNYVDIQNGPESLNTIINWFATNQDELGKAAGPGGWNDPDMLIGGNNGLTLGLTKVQMSIWSILAAPLMLGADLRNMDDDIANVLKNKEIINVNQDRLGKPGKRVLTRNSVELWTRELDSNDLALVVTHRLDKPPYVKYPYIVRLAEIQWPNLNYTSCIVARDLFNHQDLGFITSSFKVTVTPFSASMFRLSQVPCDLKAVA